MKKLLIVTYGYAPWSGAISERIIFLTKYLSELGWKCDILTATNISPHSGESVFLTSQIPLDTTIYRVGFPRLIQKYYGRSWFMLILKSLVIFPDEYDIWADYLLRQINIYRFKTHKYSAVISTSPPHGAHTVGYYMALQLGIPWLMDLRDAWIGNPSRKWRSPIHWGISFYKFKKYANSADVVIANTQEMKNKLVEKFNLHEQKVEVIPNGYDHRLLDMAKPKRPPGSLSQDLVILYSGDLYQGQVTNHLELLARSFANSSLKKSAKIIYIGEDVEFQRTPDIGPLSLGSQSIIDMISFQKGADVLLVYMPQKEKGSHRILLKAYWYAAVNKPILYVGPRNATYSYLVRYRNVHQFEHDDLHGVITALKEIVRTHPIQDIDAVNRLQDNYYNRAIHLADVLEKTI